LSAELRPLSLGELLDRTFTYYREHFWTFVGIMVPAEIVIVAAMLVLQSLGFHSLLTQQTRAMTPQQQLALLGPFLGGLFVYLVVALFAHSIAVGATSLAVSKFHLGGLIGITGAYRGLKGSIARIIGLYGLYILIMILASLAVFIATFVVAGAAGAILAVMGLRGTAAGIVVGLVLVLVMIGLVVLAVILCMRYALAVPALVLEKIGPGRALGRSSALAKGRTGQIFVACLLMYIITLVIASAIQTPFWVAGLLAGYKFGHNPLWLTAPATVAGGLGGAVGYPFLAIALTLFYYDSRVRKEGFDLQFMLSSMGPASLVDHGLVASAPDQLPEMSVVLAIVLTFITAGLYYPVWFLTRVKAFNRLRSQETFSAATFWLILFVQACALILDLVVPLSHLPQTQNVSPGHLLGLVAGIMLLMQAFKARRILENHLNAPRDVLFSQPVSLNGVAVFFFNILYLQYKINQFNKEVNIESAPAQLDAGAAMMPETPPAPGIP
jgi:hypothetical protein